MPVCPGCGRENPADFRLCPMCGTPLAAVERSAREERKIVSVLFCDLVGFTSRSEAMDVEDVRGTLQPYHELLRGVIEGYGGTVEKFIGDAVMAVFGAPVVHEDDAERAVRAALGIVQAVADLREGDPRLDLHVRLGVQTGEALIALDADPLRGEGMASGDVVNTAARLESAAPVDGVLVGEVTYRATNRTIVYAESEPVAAKGKAEPVGCWRAIEARSRFGVDVDQGSRVAMVGRERELDTLRDAAERAFESGEVQLVTLVGVPGIGKSRLVWEFSRWADGREELIRWRQGRCLPYGEGVTYWALGEMLKAEAGILESDSAEATAGKLDAMIGAAIPDPAEAIWVRRHTSGLMGLDVASGGGADREELFSAWRRLLEGLAGSGPRVAVFEDLHWADDALLDFIDHLVEWAGELPLVIVCSARPELLERRRDWGGGKLNATTVALRPLTDADTRELVGTLLEQVVLSDATREALLERAAGNPLYAEEYVRMLHDRGAVGGVTDATLPESVQGIIAARLDGLPGAEKQLLQDAAVLGKVVWQGALEALSRLEGRDLEQSLHRLTRKEFLRRAQRSTVEGEPEYAFRHVLVRDVAYGQIPRAQRADKHQVAAEWIGSLSSDRDDAIDMRAHHLSEALTYARAAGQDSPELESEVRTALRAAGQRAFRLEAYAAAATHYRAALAITAPDDPERAYLVLELGRSLGREGKESADLLEEAAGLLEHRDPAAAALAHTNLAAERARLGDGEGRREHMQRSLELVREAPPGERQARVLMNAGMDAVVESRPRDAIDLLDQFLALAELLEMPPLELANARSYRGIARIMAGDADGLAEEVAAVEELRALGSFDLTCVLNLASDYLLLGDLTNYEALMRQALGGMRVRTPWKATSSTAEIANVAYMAGRWDEALGYLKTCREAASAGADAEFEMMWVGLEARISARRGRMQDASGLEDRALELGRRGGMTQSLGPELAEMCWQRVVTGNDAGATAVLEELLLLTADPAGLYSTLPYLGGPELAEAVERLGRTEQLADHLQRVPVETPWSRALLASLAGDHAAAASLYADAGCAVDAAFADLRAAETHPDPSSEQAAAHLSRAVEFYRAVGAEHYLARAGAGFGQPA